MIRATFTTGLVLVMGAAGAGLAAQAAKETLTATATLSTAAGAKASAPVTIVVSRTTSEAEAAKLIDALKSGGAAALNKALVGIAPTGSVRIGSGAEVATRMTLERTTDKGRLLTIVTDKPLLFVGGALPGAKPKAGYDFGVLDIEIDGAGKGSGTLAPAATIKVSGTAIVVADYGSEAVRLVDVKRSK